MINIQRRTRERRWTGSNINLYVKLSIYNQYTVAILIYSLGHRPGAPGGEMKPPFVLVSGGEWLFRAAVLLPPSAGSSHLCCVWTSLLFYSLHPDKAASLPDKGGGGWRSGVCPPASPGWFNAATANKQPEYSHNPPVTALPVSFVSRPLYYHHRVEYLSSCCVSPPRFMTSGIFFITNTPVMSC